MENSLKSLETLMPMLSALSGQLKTDVSSLYNQLNDEEKAQFDKDNKHLERDLEKLSKDFENAYQQFQKVKQNG
jgi:hypothetical protein